MWKKTDNLPCDEIDIDILFKLHKPILFIGVKSMILKKKERKIMDLYVFFSYYNLIHISEFEKLH